MAARLTRLVVRDKSMDTADFSLKVTDFKIMPELVLNIKLDLKLDLNGFGEINHDKLAHWIIFPVLTATINFTWHAVNQSKRVELQSWFQFQTSRVIFPFLTTCYKTGKERKITYI